jgi:hypothetical protein
MFHIIHFPRKFNNAASNNHLIIFNIVDFKTVGIFDLSYFIEKCRWSFNPIKGLTLKNPTVSDTAFYYVSGRFPFLDSRLDLYNNNNNNNNNSNPIVHDVETTKILRSFYPLHQRNYVTIKSFSLTVTGVIICDSQ